MDGVRQKPAGTAREPARAARAARWRAWSLAVGAVLMDGVSFGLRLLPRRLRYLPADTITALVARVWPRVAIIRQNYATMLQIPVEDRRTLALARASIRNYGRMAIDFLTVRTITPRELLPYTRTIGYEHLQDALRDGHGVIFVLPHAGSWDIAYVIAEAYDVKLTVVTESDWATELVAGSRRGHGVTLVPRDGALRALFRALGRGEAVALLSDIANVGVQTMRVPFFGRPAPFPDGPARLAVRTGAPIMVLSCFRLPDATYTIEGQAPLRPAPNVSEQENVARLTAAVAAGFERALAQFPEHWYPFHPIWPEAD
jgi:lauroyl/myristoyl acyltransferase